MKKHTFLLVLLLSILLLLPLGAKDINGEKIHEIKGPVYGALNALYLSEGRALPSVAGPWSGSEIEMMLGQIDREALDDEQEALYDWIRSYIDDEVRFRWSDSVGATTGIGLGFEMHAHTNPKAFDSFDDWGGKGDWHEPEPFLTIPLEIWIGSGSYGYFEAFQANYRNLRFDPGYSWKDMYVGTNIPGLTQHASLFDTSLDFPNRGFLSLGGSWWNLFIGRDRVSWGPGETGNFQLGDQIPFLDSFRLTTFSHKLKFIMNVSSFYHPSNYTYRKNVDGEELDYVKFGRGQGDEKKGVKLFISHRLEWNALRWLNLAVTESYMYMSDTVGPDAMLLNPSTFFHNFYIRSNSNSLMSFDLNVTPSPCWNIYLQLVIDELNGEAEKKGKEAPMAFGYQAGVKFAVPYGKGAFTGYAEGVYTDPYLYLRDLGQGKDYDRYGINFVAPIVNNASGDIYYDYLGYRYGGDAVVGELGFGYEEYGKWEASGSATYMAHGCFDEHTRWATKWRKDVPHAPTSKHPEEGSYDEHSNWRERNAVSHTMRLSLSGSYTPIKALELWSRMDFISVWNFQNVQGRTESDFQFQLGIRYMI